MLDPKDITVAFKFNHLPVYQALLVLLFPIALAGFIAAVFRGTKPIVVVAQTGLMLAGLVVFPWVCDLGDKLVHDIVHKQLKASPSDTATKFIDTVYKQKGGDQDSWLITKLFSLAMNPVESLVAAFLLLVSLVAAVFMVLAYGLQAFVISSCKGLAPIFFGLLMIPAVRPIAIHYFMSVAGVIMWPLGWGIAAICTNSLLSMMTDQSVNFSVLPAGGPLYALNNLMGGFIIGVWVILSTLLAPIAIHRAMTSGIVGASGGLQALRSFLPRS
jgi:hypothetical protein